MKEVKRFYMVDTKYGNNLMAELHNGDFYQQVHQSLSYDGGGAATWMKNDLVHGVPLIINPKEHVISSGQ